MEHKHFKCFRCNLHNNFYLPIYFKGKKCKRCHIFNYFNYFKKNNHFKNNRNNQHIGERNRFYQPPKIKNHRISTKHNNNRNRNRISILNNESYNPFRNDIFDFNDNILGINNNFDNEYLLNNERNDLFYNDPPFMSSINTNNFLLNNNYTIRNNLNNNQIISSNRIISNNNYSISNFSEHNYSQNNYNSIPWLKKSKVTKDIIDKNENCIICLEKLDGEIHITKCGHVFHYECIEKSININGLDCPICRRNLKTGQEKAIQNSQSINLYSNFENNNIFRSYSNSNYNHNYTINSELRNNNRTESNNNGNFGELF